MSVNDSLDFFENIELDVTKTTIGKRILLEIKNRLKFLSDVGVGYLQLNRSSATLSGGEVQRIKLAGSLGSALVGSMYILDEPSIGLHGRDTRRLIDVLHRLRDLGNTVVVVEHDEEIMQAADYIIDLGPEAGSQGGQLVFAGEYDQLLDTSKGLTAAYLRNELEITKEIDHPGTGKKLSLSGGREHNLKNVQVDFPLGQLVVVSGVSGSGKSTLVTDLLYPSLQRHFTGQSDHIGEMDELSGDLDQITGVEFVDQNPIGRSSRSNPVTYVKAYDDVRSLFSNSELAKVRGYKPAHFSFNVEGGRCENCQGEGVIKVEMQFMADVTLTCEDCQGKRFKDEVLEIKFNDKHIADILEMTVDDAVEFFKASDNGTAAMRKLLQKLTPLQQVGLGYVQLGQSSSTLSGGEAQRIKLASFLGKTALSREKADTKPLLFIFDEPTTGLHFHDVNKLMKAFEALLDQGHSLVVIEHHPDVIKCADWVIDLGPDGGTAGGEIVFQGKPADLHKQPDNFTAQQIASKFSAVTA